MAAELVADELAVEARVHRRTALVALRGEFDLVTISKVAEVLDRLDPQAAGVRHVVLDLRGLTFMDVPALRELLRQNEYARINRHNLAVVRGTDVIARLLELTGSRSSSSSSTTPTTSSRLRPPRRRPHEPTNCVPSRPASLARTPRTAIAAFAGCFSVLERRWPIPTRGEARRIGGWWLAMTVAFKFGFGRAVAKQSWRELLADDDLRAGRTWPLVLAWIALGPAVVREVRTG